MKLFDVYPVYDITPVSGSGSYIYDQHGTKYLDFYGGHAVISIGHSHPHYVETIKSQVQKLAFYSNSINNPLQKKLAQKLGEISNCDDYSLFLCNSGAEANENALKLASFHTGKSKVLSFKRAFHGRTSAAVNATDNPKIKAPINIGTAVSFVELHDIDTVEKELSTETYAAVIIEGIQGIAGVYIPDDDFLHELRSLCTKYNVTLILDEIQSGFGRSGDFFAFQQAGVSPDIITMAKGMGNGFPVGGVLISEHYESSYGLLGTTFGGNHLACAASIAVLEVIQKEDLLKHSTQIGRYLIQQLRNLPHLIEVRGRGLMLGVEFEFPIKSLRKQLVHDYQLFTGSSSQPNTLRLLPALNVTQEQCDEAVDRLAKALKEL